MKRNNVKLLTQEDFELLNSKFEITIEDNKIVVKNKTMKKNTYHDIDKPFHINAKKIRKICFTMDAINIWKELYKEFTLFQIQSCVNRLILTYQQVNIKNVKEILTKYNLKIEEIKRI